jgi:hypothetical protein
VNLFEEAVFAQSEEFTLNTIRTYVWTHNGWWNDYLGQGVLNTMIQNNQIIPIGFDDKGIWTFRVVDQLEAVAAAVRILEESEEYSEPLLDYIPTNKPCGLTLKERTAHNRKVRAQRISFGLRPDKPYRDKGNFKH